MELGSWLSLLAVCSLGAMSPGPSAAIIIKISGERGRHHGIAAAVAHGLGVGCYALIASLGLALVITGNPILFNGLKWAGAAFLLYLGCSALGINFTRPSKVPTSSNTKTMLDNRSLSDSIRTGFLVAILNPKVALFFLALFSQFVRSDAGTGEKLFMAATATAVDILWYCLVASVVTTQTIANRFSGYGKILEKIFGLLIIAVAVKVAVG